jgi:tetratricopeptide (TPR) repeat protein
MRRKSPQRWSVLIMGVLAGAWPGSVHALPVIALPPPQDRYGIHLRRADSLVALAQLGAAEAALEPAFREARRRGDGRSLLSLTTLRAGILARTPRVREAEAAARQALWMAAARRDTASMMHGLILLGTRTVDHDALVEPAYEWLLRLALEQRDRSSEALARMGRADDAAAAGRGPEAIQGYERALNLLRGGRNWRGQTTCYLHYGDACYLLGEFDRARACLMAAERISIRLGDPLGERDANLRLGELELTAGDPESAAERYRRALKVLRNAGEPREWIATTLMLTRAEMLAGEHVSARTRLERLVMTCDSLHATDLAGQALTQLSQLFAHQGSHHEIAHLYRSALAARRPPDVEARAQLLLARARSLGSLDSAGAALDLFERQAVPLRHRVAPATRFEIDLLRADLLRRLGRQHEGLRILGRAAREPADREPTHRLQRLLQTADCYRDQGRSDSVLAVLERGLDAWEQSETPRDPTARDLMAAHARAACLGLASLAMRYPQELDEGERALAAFEILQRFKARWLMERALGPIPVSEDALTALAPPSLDDLQQRGLGEHDLLLDVHVGPDTSLLLAVTRRELRVVALPSAPALDSSLAVFRSALAGGASSRVDFSAWKTSLSEIGRVTLDPVADLIQSSRRILFSGDGPLLRIPLAALPFPTSNARSSTLGQDREVLLIPSSAFAGRPQAPDGEQASRLLALAAARGPGSVASSGALQAAQALGDRFQGGAVLLTGQPGVASLDLDQLSDYQVFHLATESRMDDRRPWRSGFRLAPDDTVPGDPFLRAPRIAGSRLPVRLAVIGRYELAQATDPTGEGAQRLGTAFLMAGVPAVVTSLWAVEEETSARFNRAFYAGLESGESVGHAVRSARSALRRHRPTRHPIHWAGFVVIGDGSVRAPLKRRFDLGLPLAFLTLAGVGAVLMALRPRRSEPA